MRPCLLTLDAYEIAKMKKEDVLFIDLDRKDIYSRVVLSLEERDENALFHQLMRMKTETALEKRDLVYLDFKRCYRKGSDLSEEAVTYLVEKGFSMALDGVTVCMKAFDKSASMSRNSQITYIDQRFLEGENNIHDRLTLGIFSEEQDYVRSKYFAYRGLYLSTGTRLKCAKEEDGTSALVLNEKTVVVLEDTVDQGRSPKNVFTLQSGEYGIFKKRMKVNCFDGEGLISPAFAERFRKQLTEKTGEKQTDTSFQIRMPFGKGMLHEVDFHQYLRDSGVLLDDFAEITDYFGQKRKVRDIGIILTASMFKCAQWLKGSKAVTANDRMQYYFGKFHEYDHALYFLQGSESLHNTGRIKLNYQLLNTAEIDAVQMEALAERSLEETRELMESEDAQIRYFLHENEAKCEIPIEEALQREVSEESEKGSLSKYARVIKENRAFIREKKLRGMIRGAVESEYLSSAAGHLSVKGEIRYLSGDLLSFLEQLCRKLRGEDFCEKRKLKNAFYAAENKIEWKAGRHYAILRNPHLSRNEQTAICAPDRETKEIYDRYFGKLTSVIMLPYASLVAARLSGADFDGDIVRVIDNKILSDAADQNTRDKAYPVIEIPSQNATAAKLSHVKKSELDNAFDNKVGLISDLAAKFGAYEYNENVSDEEGKAAQYKEKYKNYAARCCIVVGQEIDKVKTGYPPKTDDLEKDGMKLKLSFLEQKRALSVLRFRKIAYSESKKTYFLPSGKETLEIAPPSGEEPNLERLLYLVLEKRRTYSAYAKAADKGELRFQTDETKLPSTETVENFSVIMLSYLRVLKIAKMIYKLRERAKRSNWTGRVFNLLQMQYDSLESIVPLIGILYDTFGSFTVETLTTLKENLLARKWSFLAEPYVFIEENIETMLSANEKTLFLQARPLLLNFRSKGYYLLFYILEDVLASRAEESTFTLRASSAALGGKNKQTEAFQIRYKSFFEKYFTIYEDAREKKEAKALWKKKLVEACRKDMETLLQEKGCGLSAAALCWTKNRGLDVNHDFLWDIFEAEEILKLEIVKETEVMEC